MARSDGAHGVIGGIPVKYDQNAPDEIGRPSYRHSPRSLFRPGTDITGKPGSQNLREERLIWHLTDFGGGEGQVVLNGTDASARRFYRSEGLNFRVPGQFSLNQSILINSSADSTGGASSTSEGSAWSDITGTSTVVNTTDRRLNVVNDVIASATHTPGGGQVQVSFYMYKEATSTAIATIQGSAMVANAGSCVIDGTDHELRVPGSQVRTDSLVSGTELSASTSTQVRFYLYREGVAGTVRANCRVSRINSDGTYTIVTQANSAIITNTSTPSDPTVTLTFIPQTGESYRFVVENNSTGGDRTLPVVTVDKVDYVKSNEPTIVTVTVRNTSDSINMVTKQFQLSADSSSLVAQLTYNSTAAKNYQYRVTYNNGAQRPIVDKTIGSVLATTAWSYGCMELGLGGEVILVGSRAAVDPSVWFYDFTNEDWDNDNPALADCTAAAVCIGLTHSDKYEYGLFDDGRVEQFTPAGDNDYTAALTDPTGLAICQDRLFVLTEDNGGTNGVQIRTYAVDADVSAGVTSALQTVDVSSAIVSADTTLRERMCGTPTGARFFVNYSSVTSVIYEADASGSTTVVREIARLDEGTKATAICHVAGHTFIAAQTIAETGETNRSLLYVLDQSNTPRAVGYFRRDNPVAEPVISFQPFQQDLWMLQGKYVWRFSLQSGGLFCEYELNPTTASYARSIAVVQGHVFAMYAQEDASNTGGSVWVAGTVGTYRQSSVSDGSSFTSSVYDYGLPGETKQLLTVKVLTDTLQTGDFVTIDIQTDQSGTWQTIGAHTQGAQTTIPVSTPEHATNFGTLQVRATLNTNDGTSTPVLKAIVIESRMIGFEEFFEVCVLTDDEDPAFAVAGQSRTGGDIKQALWNLMRDNAPITFIDAYEHKALDNNPEYLVVLEGSDTSDDDVGEGRMMVRMRVLNG